MRSGKTLAALAWLSTILLFPSCPALAGESYSGPIFEAMAQFDHKMDIQANIRAMVQAGVTKVAVFARSYKWLGQMEEPLIKLREKHPETIVLGSPKTWDLGPDLTDQYIDHTVAGIKRHKYNFIGEILFSHGDKSDGKETHGGEWYVDPLAPKVQDFLKKIAPLKVALMTHWEVYAWDRDRPRFRELYNRYPEQVFIIPHMAFGSPAQVDDILTEHPNVYMTISKKFRTFTKHADPTKKARLGSSFLTSGKELRPEWIKLLNRHSQRLMFATDMIRSHKFQKYKKKIRLGRKLGQVLSPQAAENIFLKTGLRVYRLSGNPSHSK